MLLLSIITGFSLIVFFVRGEKFIDRVYLIWKPVCSIYSKQQIILLFENNAARQIDEFLTFFFFNSK